MSRRRIKSADVRRNNSIDSSEMSQKSKDSGFEEVDPNFRPIHITVFRNNDEFDNGTEIAVTRREFKHWIAFLELLTRRIKMPGPVNHLYTLSGQEILHFKYLEDGASYVAAVKAYKQVKYGQKKPANWKTENKLGTVTNPSGLESSESMDIYLRKLGYASTAGKSSYENARWSASQFDRRQRRRRTVSEKRVSNKQLNTIEKSTVVLTKSNEQLQRANTPERHHSKYPDDYVNQSDKDYTECRHCHHHNHNAKTTSEDSKNGWKRRYSDQEREKTRQYYGSNKRYDKQSGEYDRRRYVTDYDDD